MGLFQTALCTMILHSATSKKCPDRAVRTPLQSIFNGAMGLGFLLEARSLVLFLSISGGGVIFVKQEPLLGGRVLDWGPHKKREKTKRMASDITLLQPLLGGAKD